MELKLLMMLKDVPGVIKLYDYYSSNDCCVYVMEHPTNSIDLFDYVTQKKSLSDASACFLLRQVVQTIEQCHAKGVIHRDIKDENLLIDQLTGEVKLIDFGSASFLHEEEYTDFAGTKVLRPPEFILTSKYTANPFTVWSIGLLLFDMVQGNIPFESEKEICAVKLRYCRKISDECRHLIESCLQFDPDDRIKLEVIVAHPWMAESEARFCSD